MRRFAILFSKLGNASKAARECGYSERSAGIIGQRLSHDPRIQAYVRSQQVDRSIQAQITYEHICTVVSLALKHLVDCMKGGGDNQDRAMALAACMKALDLKGRADGIFIQKSINLNANASPETLTAIVQAAERSLAEARSLPLNTPVSLESESELSSTKVVDAEIVPSPENKPSQ